MTTNARMGLAIVGFLMIAGIATFACAERGTSESGEGMDSKDKSPGSPMEQDKGSDEMTADKGQAIETP